MARSLGPTLTTLTFWVLLSSCGGEEAPEAAVEVEEARSPAPETEPAPPGEGPQDAPTPLPAEALAELEELRRTLGAARTAAETYETGSTICEAAHASLAAMMAAVAERYPDQVADVPPKGAFVQACERLPEEAQECLLPRHVMAHQEDCRAIADGLDPDQRSYLERVLGGG